MQGEYSNYNYNYNLNYQTRDDLDRPPRGLGAFSCALLWSGRPARRAAAVVVRVLQTFPWGRAEHRRGCGREL